MKYLLRKCEIFADANVGKFHFTLRPTGAIFHNFRKQIISHSAPPNISLEIIMLLCYNYVEKGSGEMEILLEYFITVWFELVLKLVPNSKKSSKKVLFLCKLISILVLLYQVAAFTVGAIILSNSTGLEILGVVLLSSSVIIFVSQIILGIIFTIRKITSCNFVL